MNFIRRLALQEKKNLTARVSMLLKSRASLTCFRASFLPGRAKDFSAPRYIKPMEGKNRGLAYILFRNFPTIKQRHPSVSVVCPDLDSNLVPSKYKSATLPFEAL